MMNHPKIVSFLLRLSIASVFLYATIAATLQPDNWISFLPIFLTKFAPASLVLIGFSFFQLVLGLWILSGWQTFYAASFASLTIIGIIITNLSALDIVFRDFAIFFASLALAVSSYKKQK